MENIIKIVQILKPLLEKTAPSARGALIKFLTENRQE